MASSPLAVARSHTTSTTALCHCRVFATCAYVAALPQCLLRPVCCSPGLRPGVSHFARPTLVPLRCPLPSSVHRRCHVLDQEELTCPRHSGAEVSSPDRAVPGWLLCLYRPPPLGGGGGSEGATAVPDVPGWCPWPQVRARRALYEGLPIRTSGQNCCVPRGWSMGDRSTSPRVQWVSPPRGDHRPPSSPRAVSLPPAFTPRPAHQAPCAHLVFPGGAVVKNQPAKAGSCKRCKFDPSVGDPLEEEMATLSCTLAWKIPCTEEQGGLQSMG